MRNIPKASYRSRWYRRMVHKVGLGIYPKKRTHVSSHAVVNGYRISDLQLAQLDVVYFARLLDVTYRDGCSQRMTVSRFQESFLRKLRRKADARARPGGQVGDVGLDVGPG